MVVSPIFNVAFVLSKVTPVTAIIGFVTLIVHLAVLPPSFVVAVITAWPSPTAFTRPLPSTVAIFLSDVDHPTVLSLAFSGVTVAFRAIDSPMFKDASV